MVVIQVKGYRASIENYKWSCKDKDFKGLLDTYINPKGSSPSDPYPDLTVAKEVIKDLGGEIIRQDKLPESKKGVVY